ncbi:hypothetical protein JZU48_02905, partial [bacterium]|nr:hypothetical protein [bacterium]
TAATTAVRQNARRGNASPKRGGRLSTIRFLPFRSSSKPADAGDAVALRLSLFINERESEGAKYSIATT